MGDPEHNGGGRRALLGDVERHGLRAASELVDRLTRDGDGAPPPEAPAEPAPAGDDLVRLWGEGVRLFLGTITRFLPGDGAGAAVDTTLDVVEGTTEGAVQVRTTAAAGDARRREGSAVVWLHNRSDRDVPDVALHCGDLRSSDGGVLPAAALRFEPSVVELPARSSRGVLVSVTVRDGAGAGAYRGVLLATGVPRAWLPLEVDVPEMAEGER